MAKELQLAARCVVGGRDAVDERLEIGRVVLAADLELERSDLPEVGGVLVLVDRGPHLAQRVPQLRLARPLRRHLRERHHCRGEDQDDRRDDEQLHERIPGRIPLHEPSNP